MALLTLVLDEVVFLNDTLRIVEHFARRLKRDLMIPEIALRLLRLISIDGVSDHMAYDPKNSS